MIKRDISNRKIDFSKMEHLKKALLAVESYEAIGDHVKRQLCILEAVHWALIAGLDAGFRPIEEETVNFGALPRKEYENGVIAYICLPERAEYQGTEYLFQETQIAYFLPRGTEYDKHTRPDKMARINTFVNTLWTEEKKRENTKAYVMD